MNLLQTHRFPLYKMWINELELCGLLVNYCDVLYQLFELLFWRQPFTADDPLVNKWCNDTFF